MKKIWLFGSYNWQGNVKALFLYMDKYCQDTHELWWVSDDAAGAEVVKNMGFKAVSTNSVDAQQLFVKANVYVTENVRIKYPSNINNEAIILNLWHGVGLKHIELGVGMGGKLTQNIIGKNIRNFELLKNQMKLLVTSKMMEEHFRKDMALDESQIIRGSYPRNSVYKDFQIQTYNVNQVYNVDFDNFHQIILYVPTWRSSNSIGLLQRLVPNLERLNQVLHDSNSLFILKMHPHDVKADVYQEALAKKNEYPNILFWNDDYDIYEIFDHIDVGIVDYSSIFYDLLDAGVKKFIRYIPDFESYTRDSELIADYFDFTCGSINYSFEELINTLSEDIPIIDDNNLLDYFFEYNDVSMDDLITLVDHSTTNHKHYPELHSFDIFDTVIRRQGVEPSSVFYLVQTEMKNTSKLSFPPYLVERYAKIRREVERDLRIAYGVTKFERGTDTVEVTLDAILDRLKENYSLSEEQKQFLFDTEIAKELEVTEPRQKMIDTYFALKAEGKEVILISDMYLPEEVIRKMLIKVDSRFSTEKLYLSASLGYQKMTGALFEYVFFDLDYHYKRWIHHGDNKKTDGAIPRKYGIITMNHDMDTFRPYEKALVERSPIIYRNDAYRFAKLMQQYRWNCIDETTMTYNGQMYYYYAYIGSAFVPYVYWSLKHAIKQGYETLYFLSRDGHFLKQIADVLIDKLELKIKSKFIYASRKVWRIPSFIDEVDPASFTSFGMFTGMDNFADLVAASQLSESELLSILPDLANYRYESSLKGDLTIQIRKKFEHSQKYQDRLLEIAAERRPIVLDYIKQEINFQEKFAVVEFWGRGYTQDTFTRLLSECIEGDFRNPFYYVRNYTDNIGKSVRHRFTTLPYNFRYYEPIFAQTPYQSIAEYQRNEDGTVGPVIIPDENNFHELISQGLSDFASDFADLILDTESGFSRYLAEFAYEYQFNTPLDSVIVENLSVLNYNEGMYGDTNEYAPEFTKNDIRNIGIENFKKYTSSMPISMARSDKYVRDIVNRQLKTSYKPKHPSFPAGDLADYLPIEKFPIFIKTKRKQNIYQSVGWNSGSVRERMVHAGELIEVLGYEWTQSGYPRLITTEGYLTANIDFVGLLNVGDILYTLEDVIGYQNLNNLDSSFVLAKGRKIEIINCLFDDKGKEYIQTNLGVIPLSSALAVYPETKVRERIISDGLKVSKLSAKDLQGKKLMLLGQVDFYEQPSLESKKATFTPNKSNRFVRYLGEAKSDLGLRFYKTNKGYLVARADALQVSRKDIQNYIIDPVDRVQLLKPLYIYRNVNFNSETQTNQQLPKDTIVPVLGIAWTSSGTPRLKVEGGFISANKKLVRAIEKRSWRINDIHVLKKLFLRK